MITISLTATAPSKAITTFNALCARLRRFCNREAQLQAQGTVHIPFINSAASTENHIAKPLRNAFLHSLCTCLKLLLYTKSDYVITASWPGNIFSCLVYFCSQVLPSHFLGQLLLIITYCCILSRSG